MDQLVAMRVFAQIVDAGSFVKAAQALELSTPVVTRHIADLESHLGTRLLNRTTRSLNLTEAGQAYLAYCRQIVQTVDEADAQATARHAAVSGVLRLACPMSFGVDVLPPLLAAYRAKYPQVHIEITLTDRVVDLVEENLDLAIQAGQMDLAGDMVVRPLLNSVTWLCAAPAYLAQHPAPHTPDDLAQHVCLNFVHNLVRHQWLLSNASETRKIPTEHAIAANNGEMLRRLALEGIGIAPLSDYIAKADVAAGRLVRVLPAWSLQGIDFVVVYPSRRYLPAKTRSLLDFLLAQ